MPTISRRTIRALLLWLPFAPGHDAGVLAELRRALAPRSRRPRPEKVAKRAAKNKETAEIRAKVFERAGGLCECGCGFSASDLDHFWGRGKAKQTTTNTWALAHDCHRAKTHNFPSATHWVNLFARHCARNLFLVEERRADTRMAVLRQKGLGG